MKKYIEIPHNEDGFLFISPGVLSVCFIILELGCYIKNF